MDKKNLNDAAQHPAGAWDSGQQSAGQSLDGYKYPGQLGFVVERFDIFGAASILYGIFFTFCLYKNAAGITLPFLAAATIAYYWLCMKKLDRTIRRDSVFYAAGILILGIGTVFTDNSFFIFYNYAGMALLLITCLILNFFEHTNFRFGSYLAAILGMVVGSLGYFAYPFRSFRLFLSRRGKKEGKGRYVWYGILIAIPLLFVVLALLSSADAVFGKIFEDLLKNIVIPENVVGIGFTLCVGVLGSYMLLANLVSGSNDSDGGSKRTHEPVVAITFTSALTVVYLLFSFIQVFYLFLGNRELPEGYTYAQYAREGFFQLLFVCILNLLIVLICIDYFKEHMVLKIVLSVFCACTFVMIASSAMRMILYIRAYRLSIDRVLVLWALFVITILMALVCVNIYKEAFPLFRCGVAVVSVCYILLSLSRPDTYIAKYNIEASAEIEVDYDYLFYALSADAVPVLESHGILEPALGCADEDDSAQSNKYYGYCNRFLETGEKLSVRTFNFSRYKAAKISSKYCKVYMIK